MVILNDSNLNSIKLVAFMEEYWPCKSRIYSENYAPTSQRTTEMTAVCPENHQNLNTVCENMEALMLMRWYCTSNRV